MSEPRMSRTVFGSTVKRSFVSIISPSSAPASRVYVVESAFQEDAFQEDAFQEIGPL